jgi:hypothetical protein
MVVNLNRKQVEQIVDEMFNAGRKIPRGGLTLADLLLMNAFERSEVFSNVTNPGRTLRNEIEDVVDMGTAVTRKARRKKSAYGKALSRELKSLNKAARTKSGRLRKGVSQASILKKAHRNVKRAMKRRRK